MRAACGRTGLAILLLGTVANACVGQQQADALVLGDRPHHPEVGQPAVDRGEVELEVAGVEDRALRGVERGGEAVGHRVGDRDELAVERAE